MERSSDVVVIRGKSYYLHTVEAGQTLYSICKAYGADVEEVKALNEKADNALSLYEVLKIPFVEQQAEAKAQEAEKPFVQRDGKYYYHRVEKGETIYSIARRYGMRPRRLLKHNPDYSTNQPLAIGAVVRLPLEEIDPALLVEVKAAEVKVEGGSEEKQAEEVTVVARDFTKIFASMDTYYAYLKRGGRLKVLRKSRLVAVCINPTAPNGFRMDSDTLREALERSLGIPVYDVKRMEEMETKRLCPCC